MVRADSLPAERVKGQGVRTALALFVRAPVPGQVKTRLAREFGAEAACCLYRAMVDDLLANARATGWPIYLCHAGDGVTELPPDWRRGVAQVLPQLGDTLGERMAAAFARGFADGRERLLLLGSDIPGLNTELIRSAGAALDTHDVAVVPDLDGGYCLLGLKSTSCRPRLFNDIPWSTAQVFDLTVARCREEGLTVAKLAALQDIDTLDDLHSYCDNACPSALSTNRYLADTGLLRG